MVQQKNEEESSFYRILIYLLKPTIILTTNGFPVTKSLILSTLDLKLMKFTELVSEKQVQSQF